jgi:hypothetical protein
MLHIPFTPGLCVAVWHFRRERSSSSMALLRPTFPLPQPTLAGKCGARANASSTVTAPQRDAVSGSGKQHDLKASLAEITRSNTATDL